MHAVDLMVPCPVRLCGARAGKECKGLAPGIVHLGRRIKMLMLITPGTASNATAVKAKPADDLPLRKGRAPAKRKRTR